MSAREERCNVQMGVVRQCSLMTSTTWPRAPGSQSLARVAVLFFRVLWDVGWNWRLNTWSRTELVLAGRGGFLAPWAVATNSRPTQWKSTWPHTALSERSCVLWAAVPNLTQTGFMTTHPGAALDGARLACTAARRWQHTCWRSTWPPALAEGTLRVTHKSPRTTIGQNQRSAKFHKDWRWKDA